MTGTRSDGDPDDPGSIDGPEPAVGAVVVDGDDVLLVEDAAREAWTLPTGRVEAGESVRTTARREVREEAGVDVSVDRLAGVYSHPDTQVFEHRSGRRIHFVTTLVVCTYEGGDPRGDGEETTDAAFVAREDLPEMPPMDRWVRDALADREPTLR